jgi:hypothetical protein
MPPAIVPTRRWVGMTRGRQSCAGTEPLRSPGLFTSTAALSATKASVDVTEIRFTARCMGSWLLVGTVGFRSDRPIFEQSQRVIWLTTQIFTITSTTFVVM